MNLRIFFDTVNETDQHEVYEPNALIGGIESYRETFPHWQTAEIAIIGIVEERGTQNKDIESAPDEIRKKLYQLNKGTGNKRIVDLGNLRRGVSLIESQNRLKEVCEILLAHNVFVLLIGGGHDMDYGQFLGYEANGQPINVLNVDACLDMFGSNALGENRHHTHQIFVHEPNILFHYTHLAYQSFLTDPSSMAVLEKLHFETYRLGAMRDNMEDMEPIVRNADMLSFDIGAIKKSDAPGNIYAQPFGLTSEEACQLCWYAGLSTKLSSAGFYEFNPAMDDRAQTASVIATMIWYLIEGISLRNETVNQDNFIKYIVSLPQEPHKLVFFKDSRTEKWWMEVPYAESKSRYASSAVVPCSYADYVAANKGDIPNRWILMHAKLI